MKTFKLFLISDLFDIHPTKAYKLTNSDLYAGIGNTPVLSNSSVNNGIGGYTNLKPTEEGGIITFSDTTTGANTMFYQPVAFIGYPHVQGMYPHNKSEWDEKSCLYLIGALQKACGTGYDYANKFTRKIVLSTKVFLPVASDDKIDFAYMQERIAELEQERIAELEHYLIASGLNDYELTEEDVQTLSLSPQRNSKIGYNDDDCRVLREEEFRMNKIFKSSTGDVDLQQKDINGEGCYFINSGLENSGIKGKTDRPAKIFSANTITVDFWGNVFYRDFQYKMATHNHVFSLSGEIIKNEAVGLFLVSKMSFLKKLYSYNEMGTWNKMKLLTISLPIKTDAENNPIIDRKYKYHSDGYIPDFEYMEKYIKAMQKVVIADVVRYKDKVIDKTKVVVS